MPAPFVANDGITFEPATYSQIPEDAHQPMDVGSGDGWEGNVSDTMASMVPLHPGVGVPDQSFSSTAPVGKGDWTVQGDPSTTTHMPTCSTTPALTSTLVITPTPILNAIPLTGMEGQAIPAYQGAGFVPGAMASPAQRSKDQRSKYTG